MGVGPKTPRARAELPRSGDLVAGKYRLGRVLGEGGMGVVFEAVHERIDQRVAVKMLLPQVLDSPDVVARFEREARAAGRLRSRNAARVIDVDTTAGALPFLVMEYLEGHDLAVELERRGHLPVEEAVGYLLQACNAMLEAHSSGIVHRDLKPSNLFLADDGHERVVKVLDFGISKLTFEADSKITATSTTIGTPAYMSPEQVRSARDVDERTDVWSLGIILYESLTGVLPFDGSPTAVAAAIVADTPARLKALRPDVPLDLESVVAKTLAKQPADRFQDVRALAVALAPFAPAGTSVLADPGRNVLRPIPAVPFLEDAKTVNMNESERSPVTVPGWTARTERKGSRMAFAFFAVTASLIAGGILLVTALSKSSAPAATPMTMSRSPAPSPPPVVSPSTSTSTAAPASSASSSEGPAVSTTTSAPTPTASARSPARVARPAGQPATGRPAPPPPATVPAALPKPAAPDHI